MQTCIYCRVCELKRVESTCVVAAAGGRQKLDVRVVYTGNVSFCKIEGWAGAGLYSRIHQQQTVGARGFITFPWAAHPNPRAKRHESLPPLKKGKTWKRERIRETAALRATGTGDKVNKVKIKGKAEAWLILLFLSDIHSFIHKDEGGAEVWTEESV